ncbi:Rpp20 subunit of nuclear RNase MRP and P-domain-containing protein [Aspergillus egyptiacus]|nr:Rpp20 subunit of nuclear RNase MRP and P-domain-containing protein [Aspergillus egyptiacus]
MPDPTNPPLHLPDLTFERKNQDMLKLPKYAKVHPRPIPHPAISSPYAGPSTPKTIYISTKTPYMSAVKRVQKLLRQAEKRATASVDAAINKNRRAGGNQQQRQQNLLAALARGEEGEQLSKEEVFVKATGRAMDVALKVGRWFEREGRKGEYKVRVSTGSVLVVDDVEVDDVERERAIKEMKRLEGKPEDDSLATVVTAADTTVLSDKVGVTATDTTALSEKAQGPATLTPETSTKSLSKSALKKRKRTASLAASLAETELPEARTRWVNSVEVAISLK